MLFVAPWGKKGEGEGGGGGGGLERIHLPQGEGRRDLPDRGNQMIKHRERDG